MLQLVKLCYHIFLARIICSEDQVRSDSRWFSATNLNIRHGHMISYSSSLFRQLVFCICFAYVHFVNLLQRQPFTVDKLWSSIYSRNYGFYMAESENTIWNAPRKSQNLGFNWPPPKKLNYVKPRLGESTLT